MINENLKLSGQLNIVLKDKAGNVKDSRDLKNLVVNSGLAYIASRMKDTTKGAMSHMALGVRNYCCGSEPNRPRVYFGFSRSTRYNHHLGFKQRESCLRGFF